MQKADEHVPGRIGFRAGLIRAALEAVPAVADLGRVVVFVFALSAACGAFVSALGGVRELSVPSRPRFMILAGVTGVIRPCNGTGVGAGVCSAEPVPCTKCIVACGWGAAGGGIDRSTGEGVSPGTSFGVIVLRLGPLRLDRFEVDVVPAEPIGGNSGVELADLVPPRKLPRRVRFIDGMDGATVLCGMERRPACA